MEPNSGILLAVRDGLSPSLFTPRVQRMVRPPTDPALIAYNLTLGRPLSPSGTPQRPPQEGVLWDLDDPAHRSRILKALQWWTKIQKPLRDEMGREAVFAVDFAGTQTSLEWEEVSLAHRETGAKLSVMVDDLFEANPVFARIAGFKRGYELRREREWDAWDRVLAWHENNEAPFAALFDLPDALRTTDRETLPLLGWSLHSVQGPFQSSKLGEAIFAVHPHWDQPLELSLKHMKEAIPNVSGDLGRALSRTVYLGEAWGRGQVIDLDWHAGEIEAQTIPRFAGQASEIVTLPLEEFYGLNPDRAEALRKEQKVELSEAYRRLEAHAAAGGVWVFPHADRERLGRPNLPLTGWTLAPQEIGAAHDGEVWFEHAMVPEGLATSLGHAVACKTTVVPPGVRILDDPSYAAPGMPAYVRQVSATGILMTGGPADPLATGAEVAHSEWLKLNPTLAPAFLRWRPDIGVISEDPAFRQTLNELLQGEMLGLEPWRDQLTVSLVNTSTEEAIGRLSEVLVHTELKPTLSWRGPLGHTWRWVGMTSEGRFRAAVNTHSERSLPGETIEGLLVGSRNVLGELYDERLLTPQQMAFCNPHLVRWLVEWQMDSGLVGTGDPLRPLTRLRQFLHQMDHDLSGRIQSVHEHLSISSQLGEGVARQRVIQSRLERLKANLKDVRHGKALKYWVDEEEAQSIGVGLTAGGVHGAVWRTGDDRVRVTSGMKTAWLGRFRIASVGGGNSFTPEPSGPRVSELLDRLEGQLARHLFDCVSVDEAFSRALDVIVSEGHEPDGGVPYCSLVLALTHLDSGATTLYWSGNSGAWRFRRDRLQLTNLTTDHTLEGFVQLAESAGLSHEDAVSFVMFLMSRRTQRTDIEELSEQELLHLAKKYAEPGKRIAIRSALGGNRESLDGEHQRLLTLFDVFQEWHPQRRIHPDSLRNGKAMVFRKRLRLLRDERIILASDGFRLTAESEPLFAARALDLDSPQRAAEWLLHPPGRDDGATDDLGIIILDLKAEHLRHANRTRRKGQIYKITEDQSSLHEGGIVSLQGANGVVNVRITQKPLSKFHGEVSDLVRGNRIPDPKQRPAQFVMALAKWALAHKPMARRSSQKGEALLDLHRMFDEPNNDLTDEILMTFVLLRRFKFNARYVTGLRVLGTGARESTEDCCWVEVVIDGKRHLLDLSVSKKPVLIRAKTAYRTGTSVKIGGMLRSRTEHATWLPDPAVYVEIPTYESASPDPDPWLRYEIMGRRTQGFVNTPRSDFSQPPDPTAEAPSNPFPRDPTEEAEAPAPESSGWLEF